jgi:flavin-dependent dehydrogenase
MVSGMLLVLCGAVSVSSLQPPLIKRSLVGKLQSQSDPFFERSFGGAGFIYEPPSSPSKLDDADPASSYPSANHPPQDFPYYNQEPAIGGVEPYMSVYETGSGLAFVQEMPPSIPIRSLESSSSSSEALATMTSTMWASRRVYDGTTETSELNGLTSEVDGNMNGFSEVNGLNGNTNESAEVNDINDVSFKSGDWNGVDENSVSGSAQVNCITDYLADMNGFAREYTEENYVSSGSVEANYAPNTLVEGIGEFENYLSYEPEELNYVTNGDSEPNWANAFTYGSAEATSVNDVINGLPVEINGDINESAAFRNDIAYGTSDISFANSDVSESYKSDINGFDGSSELEINREGNTATIVKESLQEFSTVPTMSVEDSAARSATLMTLEVTNPSTRDTWYTSRAVWPPEVESTVPPPEIGEVANAFGVSLEEEAMVTGNSPAADPSSRDQDISAAFFVKHECHRANSYLDQLSSQPTSSMTADDQQYIAASNLFQEKSTSGQQFANHEHKPFFSSPIEKPFFTSFAPHPPQRRRNRLPVPKDLSKTRIQRIMERIRPEGQAGGAGGSSTFDAFLRAEQNWAKLKAAKPVTFDSQLSQQEGAPPIFVSDDIAQGSFRAWKKLRENRKKLDYDAVVCGGTLGIFFATALALKGHKVCVVEGGELRGREQEWNISMDELKELVHLGVLKQEEVEEAVTTEFPGCRAGFKNMELSPLSGGYFENNIGYECFAPDVLNLGVSPKILLEKVKNRFLELGGEVKEQTRLQGVVVSERLGAGLDLGPDQEPITSNLVLDCMGNASPISRQQRYGKKPDGVCAVVGSCAGGFDPTTNTIGDIIYTNSEIRDLGKHGKLQYFWETFPVGIGRSGNEPGSSDVKTTYMFTYFDAEENRPSLEMLMDDYLDMLPKYQPFIEDPEDDLDFKRVLFAYFPTYKESPLKPNWCRVLAVGDASGIQSPLSFGGFGSLTRHLGRITGAISEALNNNLLQKDDLAEINAYQPNLSAAWMFQKAMSIRMGQQVDSKFVNRLLATNFEVMNDQGQRVIKPFLQDVVRFDGLASSLSGSFVKDPTFMPQIVKHVGLPTLAEWLVHVVMMAVYGFLHAIVSPVLKPFVNTFRDVRKKFQWRRRMEAWKFGSGSDYILREEKHPNIPAL